MFTQTPAQCLGLNIGDMVIVGFGRKCQHDFTVGDEAKFYRDDGTDKPLFEQDGETQYLDLSEITLVVYKTPAQLVGIEVGDTVELLKPLQQHFFGSKYTQLLRDDDSEMPRFGMEGESLWIALEDVRKVATGPKDGVLWSEAPIGATHYSLSNDHGQKWHKLDSDGVWAYARSDCNKTTTFAKYADDHFAKVSTQVAIPSFAVEVNPMNAVFEEVKALEEQVRGKLRQVADLDRGVARLNVEKQAKITQINEAGFSIVGGELVKLPAIPVAVSLYDVASTWQEGDTVRCVRTGGSFPANVRVGGLYKVTVTDRGVCIRDSDGDAMRGCVERGCFVLEQRATVVEWKAGQRVEALVSGADITKGRYYVLTYVECGGAFVGFRDNVNFARRRPASEFKIEG